MNKELENQEITEVKEIDAQLDQVSSEVDEAETEEQVEKLEEKVSELEDEKRNIIANEKPTKIASAAKYIARDALFSTAHRRIAL